MYGPRDKNLATRLPGGSVYLSRSSLSSISRSRNGSEASVSRIGNLNQQTGGRRRGASGFQPLHSAQTRTNAKVGCSSPPRPTTYGLKAKRTKSHDIVDESGFVGTLPFPP